MPVPLFVLHNFFIGFIGDAARYLRVHVGNIKQREIIRKNGVNLLKALHKTGDYDRIILVGHSLGSVIAYDILTYLWIDFNKAINLNQKETYSEHNMNDWACSFGMIKQDNEELKAVVGFAAKVKKNAFLDSDIDNFQKAQSELWKKIQYERKSWLISDLVTLGSPLRHAKLLMADCEDDFYLRKEEREYPTCPPVLDNKDLTYTNGNGETFLHHATPFAVTRWSNLYYKGDFIGGEVSDNLGPGIKDIRVKYTGGWLRKIFSCVWPGTHVHYWMNSSNVETEAEGKEFKNRKEHDTIETLYDAMRIADLESDIYP